MSTRSVVIVKQGNKDCSIYHHWDGYPEGVGYDLLERSKDWGSAYINDWDATNVINNLLKDKDECYEFKFYIHPDIEYLYVIDCDNKKVKCFKVIININDDYTLSDNNWKEYKDIYEGKFGQEIDIYKKFPEIFEDKEKGE